MFFKTLKVHVNVGKISSLQMVLIMESNPVYGFSDDSESDTNLDGIPEPTNDDVAEGNCNYYNRMRLRQHAKAKGVPVARFQATHAGVSEEDCMKLEEDVQCSVPFLLCEYLHLIVVFSSFQNAPMHFLRTVVKFNDLS